jgi:hypothetical protein
MRKLLDFVTNLSILLDSTKLLVYNKVKFFEEELPYKLIPTTI